MPCNCEGYETADYRNYDQAHKMCCQAQWLAHSLGKLCEKYGIEIGKDMMKLLKAHRDMLLKHKQEELAKDIEKAESAVDGLVSKIKKIKGLGGLPTEATLKELEKAQVALLNLKQYGTGYELLG